MEIPRRYRNVGKGKRFEIENITTLDDYPKIAGYDFAQPFDLDQFITHYFSTGFQATHLAQAIQISTRMLEDKATIYLSFTSNIVSSGLRDQIRFLVQHKLVHLLCTTAGGIEEDVIKCFKPFVVGSFDVSGKFLFDKGVARIGNIFVPNDRYLYFEDFMNKFFESVYKKQKDNGVMYYPSLLLMELGLFLNHEESYLTWA